MLSALHTEVNEESGVDHGHLETANPLTTKGWYVFGRTLVVTLSIKEGKSGRKLMNVENGRERRVRERERDTKRKGQSKRRLTLGS